jgi:hypothetical protein
MCWGGLVLAAVIAAAPGVRNWYLVDDCLDRSGAWDYESERCELPGPTQRRQWKLAGGVVD